MRIIIRLLEFIKPHLGEVLGSILLGVATIASGIGLLGTSAYLIASAALHPSIAELQVAIVGVRFFGISRAAFRYSERLVSHSINLRLVSSLRTWFYQQVTQLRQEDFALYRSGDLLDRAIHDLETLENFYIRVLSPFIVFTIVTIGVSLFAGNFDPSLGWLLASGLLITGVLLPIASVMLTRSSAKEAARQNSDLAGSLVEMLAGLEELQAFGTSSEVLNRITAINKKVNHTQLKTATLGGINNGLVLLAMNLTILALIWFSVPLIQEKMVTGVSLAVIVLVATASFEAAAALPAGAQRLTESVSAAEKLFAIADAQPGRKAGKLFPLSAEARELRLVDVSFRRVEIPDFSLEHISIDLAKRKKIAIIGPSGGGKSSLVDLILKFYQPDAGRVLINGEDTQNLDTEAVRSQFSVLSQESNLFNCSLRENLLLANPQAGDGELLEVLTWVGLESWVTSLPEDLDTWLGERGTNVSGGELQRIKIARLMLQDRPFLILDEPMVNLDQPTLRDLSSMLLTKFSEKGILWITHTYESLERMDEILYIENGRILERGDHASLLARNGNYALLYKKQQLIPD